MSCQYRLKSLAALDLEAIVIESLALRQYHEICSRNLSHKVRSVCTLVTASPGGVIFCPSNGRLEDWVQVAIPDVEIYFYPWENAVGDEGELMEDNWTRY